MFLGRLLLYSSACLKDDYGFEEVEKLPAITQSGKNTLGFTVDSDIWTPKNDYKSLSPVRLLDIHQCFKE